MQTTLLDTSQLLPLTCSRKGTCCHGNQVLINPWELHVLAQEKKCTPKAFYQQYIDEEGMRLRFEGAEMRGKKACNLYVSDFGCSVHEARPLACRLFPLGRMMQQEQVNYLFQGTTFPCLSGCEEILHLPQLTVETYLKEQETDHFERAQDAYLEVVQNLADNAFIFLLDSGLSDSGDTLTLTEWRRLGTCSPAQLRSFVPDEWFEILLFPSVSGAKESALDFVQAHDALLQVSIESKYNNQLTFKELSDASCLMMALALLLSKTIGADAKGLSELWIETAQSHGALEA
jgi:Fe-S-cluster containining protein